MKKQKVRNPRFLQAYIDKLGIRWVVKTVIVEGIATFMINSNDTLKKHEIYVPPIYYQSGIKGERMFQWVHELGHAHLCEKINRLFSKIYLSRKYDGEMGEWIQSRKMQLYDCVSHVDLWVDEKMNAIDPALNEANQEYFFEGLERLVAAGHSAKLSSSDTWICLAMAIAVDFRVGQDEKRGMKFVRMYDLFSRDTILNLIKAYKNLPSLTYDPAKDLLALEQSAQAVARVLRFSFEPRLIRESGKFVWLVD